MDVCAQDQEHRGTKKELQELLWAFQMELLLKGNEVWSAIDHTAMKRAKKRPCKRMQQKQEPKKAYIAGGGAGVQTGGETNNEGRSMLHSRKNSCLPKKRVIPQGYPSQEQGTP